MAGRYDAIVSVEMIEAVGRRFWRDYFATLDRLLRPGGRIGLQSITISHDRLLATQDSYTWIHKYIFPGGIVPSIEAIDSTLRAHTSLAIAERRDFGRDYATTLKCWRDKFLDELADDRRATASTASSSGCGSSTSPTAKPGSAPATSA